MKINTYTKFLWSKGFKGQNIGIGHLDTGIHPDHLALKGKIRRFCEVGPEGELLRDMPPSDDGFHGTHIAGVLCGDDMGIAPSGSLYGAKVLDDGEEYLRILKGMEWMSHQDVRVLCMPLGLDGYNPIFQTMIDALLKKGILTVCPIGNRGIGNYLSPAIYENVLAVGAIDENAQIAPFSGSYNRNGKCIKPDVLALGTNINSASKHSFNQSHILSGTSQACAIVAGIAALLFQAVPGATPLAVLHAIQNTADGSNASYSKYGEIKPQKALEYLEKNNHSYTNLQTPIPKYVDPYLLQLCESDNRTIWCLSICSDIPLALKNLQYLKVAFNQNECEIQTMDSANLIYFKASGSFIRKWLQQTCVIASSAGHKEKITSLWR